MKYFLILIFVFLISCKDNIKYDCTDEQVTQNVKYSEIQDIFNNNCTSCHNTQLKSFYGDLDLSNNAYNQIVNVLSSQRSNEFLIKEFSPDSSYLYRKLIDKNIDGDIMPPSGNFSQININKIKLWIEQGAKNE